MHFRISTQGGYKPELTHPYPLSEEMSDLRRLSCSTDVGIAHNGIISLTISTKKDVDYNDTMLFITDYLSLIIRDTDYWKDPVTVELISRLADSKLAILDRSGHCELIGDFVEKDGVYYSNHSYEYGYTYSFLRTELYEDFMSYYGTDEDEFCPLMYGYDYEACFECPHKEDCYDSDEEIMRYIV